jgi:outer membrane protein assembly factor BamB
MSPTSQRRLASVCLLWLAGHTIASAQQWPQFRGLHGGLAADDAALPDTWGETQNVAWKIDIPGRGWSSPIVWGEHVFVTTAINARQPMQQLLRPEAYRGASMGGDRLMPF